MSVKPRVNTCDRRPYMRAPARALATARARETATIKHNHRSAGFCSWNTNKTRFLNIPCDSHMQILVEISDFTERRLSSVQLRLLNYKPLN